MSLSITIAAITINAIAQTTNNSTTQAQTNIGRNGVLIKIKTDNITSWSAIITSGPGGVVNGSSTNLNGIGDRNFLVACPSGRYDITIGIDATADRIPNLDISAIFAGHVINSQHLALVGGMHQVPNGKFSIVGGKYHQLVNSTNIADLSGACP